MVSFTTLRIFEVILVVPFVGLGLRSKLSSKVALVLSFTISKDSKNLVIQTNPLDENERVRIRCFEKK